MGTLCLKKIYEDFIVRITSLLCTLILLVIAPPASAKTPLGSDSLKRLIPGSTFYGRTLTAGDFELEYHRDGTASLLSDDDQLTATGTWRISNDRLCVTWEREDDDSERCSRWTQVNGTRFSYGQDHLSSTVVELYVN